MGKPIHWYAFDGCVALAAAYAIRLGEALHDAWGGVHPSFYVAVFVINISGLWLYSAMQKGVDRPSIGLRDPRRHRTGTFFVCGYILVAAPLLGIVNEALKGMESSGATIAILALWFMTVAIGAWTYAVLVMEHMHHFTLKTGKEA